jgi:hypothetical protein
MVGQFLCRRFSIYNFLQASSTIEILLKNEGNLSKEMEMVRQSCLFKRFNF